MVQFEEIHHRFPWEMGVKNSNYTTTSGGRDSTRLRAAAIIQFVRKLLAAPATNDRGPRYMERALAAVHQAHRSGPPVTFLYAATDGRVGLFLECDDADAEFVG